MPPHLKHFLADVQVPASFLDSYGDMRQSDRCCVKQIARSVEARLGFAQARCAHQQRAAINTMTNRIRNFQAVIFPRTDSAQEIHGDAITKPFAHRTKLSDLIGGKPAPMQARPLKDFPLTPPRAPSPALSADVREELASVGDTAATEIIALNKSEESGFRTMRYEIASGPTTAWSGTMGDAAHHADVSAPQLALQADASDKLALNRGGGAAALACDSDAHTKVFLGQNFNSTGAGIAQTLDASSSGTDVLRADFFGAENLRGIALADTWTATGGTRVGGSLAAVLVGGTQLDPMHWDDHAPADAGRVLAKWQTQLMPIIACDVGVSWIHLGGAVRASAYKSRQNVYQVFLKPEELGSAMLRRHGLAHAVTSGLETLGWKKAPIGLPVLNKVLTERQANHLQVGESVRVVRTGNMSIGVSLSAYGFRTGIYGSYTGETELTVARVDEHFLDVIVAPKQIKSLSANLDALIAAELYTTASIATGLSRGFRVDLREAAARESLQRLFDQGQCPGCDNTPARLGAHASVDMTQQVRHGQLPVGIRTLFMQRAEHIETRWGLGMPKPFFLTGRVAGLGLEGKVFEGLQTTTDGAASVTTKTMGRGTQRDAWRAGSKYKQITAGVRRLEVFDASGRPEARFDGLEVKLVKGLTRVVGDARAKLTRKIGQISGAKIAEPQQKGDAQTYAVTIERLFTEDDLARLASTSGMDRLRAGLRSGVPVPAITSLVHRLQDLVHDHGVDSLDFKMKSAAEIQAFVVVHGQHAFAAVHHMARGSKDDIDVDVISSAFDKPVKKVFGLQLEYGTARDARSIKRGVVETKRVGKEVKRGVSQLQDDTILKTFDPQNHSAKVTALQAVQSEVEQFLIRLNERMSAASQGTDMLGA